MTVNDVLRNACVHDRVFRTSVKLMVASHNGDDESFISNIFDLYFWHYATRQVYERSFAGNSF